MELSAGVEVQHWIASMKGKNMLQEQVSNWFVGIHLPKLSLFIAWRFAEMTLTLSERLLVLSVASALQLGIGFVETAKKKKVCQTKNCNCQISTPLNGWKPTTQCSMRLVIFSVVVCKVLFLLFSPWIWRKHTCLQAAPFRALWLLLLSHMKQGT